jgi:hypothetical protein
LLRKVTNLHRLLPPTYLLTYFLPYPSWQPKGEWFCASCMNERRELDRAFH